MEQNKTELTSEEVQDILSYCAKNNTLEFNAFKAIEETTEFNEALIKFITKHPDNKKRPTKEDILKEAGDVMYRTLIVLANIYNVDDFDKLTNDMLEHVDSKLTKLIEYREQGKYKKGL